MNIRGMRQVSPGVYKDQFGDFHVDEEQLLAGGAPVGDIDDIDGIDGDDDAIEAALGYLDELDGIDGADDPQLPGIYAGFGDAVGRVKNSRKRKKLRDRYSRKKERLDARFEKKGINTDGKRGGAQTPMQNTAENAQYTLTAAGTFPATVVPQYDFHLKDIVFDAPSGTTVSEIKAGDRVLWSSSAGIPMSIFGTTSFKQHVLAGGKIKAGLTLRVTFTATATSGTVNCVFIGEKPAGSC